MKKEIRPYQREAIDIVKAKVNKSKKTVRGMLVMATGCHAKGTKILMYDGSVKNVEDITLGNQLMGDDSTPRNVLSLARGQEMMYRITPVKGDSFIVNESHILALKRTGTKEITYPQYVNISVKDYLKKNNNFKHLYKQWRTGVEMPNIGSDTDPYWIGLWLGDGTFDRPVITCPDKEVQNWCMNYFEAYCAYNHPEINIRIDNPKERCSNINFVIPNGGNENRQNSILNVIRKCTITGEKRIPDRNLRNSKKNRLELLAGLLDTDGYLHDDGCSYEIITKYKGLSEDILFLVRSLGLAAYCSEKIGKIKSLGFEGLYYRINISGHTSIIPCKIERKKANTRQQLKDVLVTGFKVEPIGVDDYYGFELDGNHLYCMGDFTVTHNTGKTFTAVRTIAELQFKKVLWITHTEELVDQSAKALIYEYFATDTDFHPETILDNYADVIDFKAKNQGAYGLFSQSPAEQLINNAFGIIKAERMDTTEPLIIASIQTLHRRLDKLPSNMFDCIIIDECDLAGAVSFRKCLDHFTPKLLLGLTATPYRTDNMLLTNLFDEILYEYTIEQGIEDGFLCELDAIRIRTDLSLDNVGSQGGDFKTGELEQVVNTPKRNNLIVDSYEKYAKGRQFMGFCVDVQHAKDLTATFHRRGYANVDFVVGDKQETTDRKGTIARFKNAELLGLNNVMVLTVGFDYSEVGCLLKACPTKSKRKYVQGAGRGTRLKKGQYKDCIILDFVDNTRKHSLVNTETLDEGKTFEKKIFMTKKKKAALIEKRDQRKFKAETKKDEKVNLFKLPEVVIYHSGRNLEPASEKQLAWVEKLGYNTKEMEYTKAMCSEIISLVPAWDKADIALLRNNGYDVDTHHPTIGQVAKAKTEIEARKLTNSKIALPFNDL